jgi:hypothetical protein
MPRSRAAFDVVRAARRTTASVLLALACAFGLSACVVVPWGAPAPQGTPSSTGDAAPSNTAPTITPIPSPAPPLRDAWVRPGEIPVGSCVQIADGVRYTTFQVTDCDEMHDGQVVAQGIIGGDDLPAASNEARWDGLFDTQCVPAFGEFTGTSWDESRLSMYPYTVEDPAEFTAGHRALTCVIAMYDGTRFAGSAQSKRREEQFKHESRWKAPSDEELYGDQETHRA